MKQTLIGCIAALALIGCSKSAAVNVALTSDDTQALRTGTAYLTTANATADGGSTDLTTVQSVTVTVNEIDAHVAGSGDEKEVDSKTDDVDSTKVDDHDGKWNAISTTPQTLDLMTLRGGIAQSIGTAQLPDGKITEIRLKLKADPGTDGKDVISGAVVDANGQTCDLLVPHSAIDPGVKIEGVFKAMKLKAGDKHYVEVNLKLKDSQRDTSTGTCAFFLNPVIKVKTFKDEGPDDGKEPADGTPETESADGGA